MKKLFENWKRYLNEQPVPPRLPMPAQKMPPKDIEVAAPRAPEEAEKMDRRPPEPTDQLVSSADIDIKPKYTRGHYKNVGDWFKHYQKIAKNFTPLIDNAANQFAKTPEEQHHMKLFLIGTIGAESRGRPKVRGPILRKKDGTVMKDQFGNPDRAYGLTQFKPRTASRMAIKYLNMDRKNFNKKWLAGGWKDPQFMINLAAVYYNKLKSNIQTRYKKKHGKVLAGENLLNAIHIAYSHGPNNKYFKKLLKRGNFSPKGFARGKAAPKYTSKAAQLRFYYQDFERRKTAKTRRVPRTPPKEIRSPRRGIEKLPKSRRIHQPKEFRSPRFGMEG